MIDLDKETKTLKFDGHFGVFVFAMALYGIVSLGLDIAGLFR